MKFKKKKHKKNKNKEIYKRNLKSQTPEGKSFFKQIPDSPGALAGFMITIMTVYSKVHWGKEIKGKDTSCQDSFTFPALAFKSPSFVHLIQLAAVRAEQ